MVSPRRSANIITACSISHLSSPAHAAFSSSPTVHILTTRTLPTSTQLNSILHLSSSSRQRVEKPIAPSTKTRRHFLLSSSAFALAALTSPRPSSSFPVVYPFSSLTAASVANTPTLTRKPPSSILYLAGQNSCESSTMAAGEELSTGYLNAEDAASLDAELMSSPGFSLEQLMELAGLAVAEAVYQVAVTDAKDGANDETKRKKHVLLVCGPGNNGGDGLVAARHLVHFGLDATIVYPKPSGKTHFVNLIQQCKDMNIPVLDEIPTQHNPHYDVIVDSIFGFSFRGTAPREPFATAIQQMVRLQQQPSSSSGSSSSDRPILVSVDVPSGWDVDGGDLTGTGFHPDVLVSLTAPKLSAKKFRGRHFVGGRFLPPAIAEKYGIRMPNYPGVAQVMELM